MVKELVIVILTMKNKADPIKKNFKNNNNNYYIYNNYYFYVIIIHSILLIIFIFSCYG